MITKGGDEMRKLTFIIIVLGVIVSFLSCATSDKKLSEPEGVLLSQSELEQLFSKNLNLIRRDNTFHPTMRLDMRPNGMQMMTWLKEDGEHRESMSGMYTIKNGQKCDNYIGQEKCWNIYKVSEEKYYFETNDGSEHGYMSRY
jgi:hypothetical protein